MWVRFDREMASSILLINLCFEVAWFHFDFKTKQLGFARKLQNQCRFQDTERIKINYSLHFWNLMHCGNIHLNCIWQSAGLHDLVNSYSISMRYLDLSLCFEVIVYTNLCENIDAIILKHHRFKYRLCGHNCPLTD